VPARFMAVSPYYADFTQVSDEDVRCLLHPPVGHGDAESSSRPDEPPG